MKTNGSHTSIVSVSIPTHSGNSTGRMIGRPQQLTGWFFQTPPRAACGWTGRRTITNSATRWAEGVSRRGSSPPRRQVWKKRSPVLPLRSRRNPAPAGNPFQLARHPKCVRRPRAVRQHTLHARTNEGLVVNSQNRPLYDPFTGVRSGLQRIQAAQLPYTSHRRCGWQAAKRPRRRPQVPARSTAAYGGVHLGRWPWVEPGSLVALNAFWPLSQFSLSIVRRARVADQLRRGLSAARFLNPLCGAATALAQPHPHPLVL